jgi:hypothetical protein
MQDLGSTTVGSTPEELTRYLQAEIAKGLRSFAMPTFASTVETHLILLKG